MGNSIDNKIGTLAHDSTSGQVGVRSADTAHYSSQRPMSLLTQDRLTDKFRQVTTVLREFDYVTRLEMKVDGFQITMQKDTEAFETVLASRDGENMFNSMPVNDSNPEVAIVKEMQEAMDVTNDSPHTQEVCVQDALSGLMKTTADAGEQEEVDIVDTFDECGGLWISLSEQAKRVFRTPGTVRTWRESKYATFSKKNPLIGKDKKGHIFRKTSDKDNAECEYFVKHG